MLYHDFLRPIILFSTCCTFFHVPYYDLLFSEFDKHPLVPSYISSSQLFLMSFLGFCKWSTAQKTRAHTQLLNSTAQTETKKTHWRHTIIQIMKSCHIQVPRCEEMAVFLRSTSPFIWMSWTPSPLLLLPNNWSIVLSLPKKGTNELGCNFSLMNSEVLDTGDNDFLRKCKFRWMMSEWQRTPVLVCVKLVFSSDVIYWGCSKKCMTNKTTRLHMEHNLVLSKNHTWHECNTRVGNGYIIKISTGRWKVLLFHEHDQHKQDMD